MDAETEIVPAEVFSLADFLCDEMDARGWTTDDVARGMGEPDKIASNALKVGLLISVQKDSLILSDDDFAGLARAFDVSEALFRNLDAVWRKWPDRRSDFSAPEHLFGPIVRRGLTVPQNDNPGQ